MKEALHTDMNAILIAMEGRSDMLRAIFGGKGPSQKDKRPIADRLKSFAKVQNELWKRQRG